MSRRQLSKKLLEEAAFDVECSATANAGLESGLEEYKTNATFAAVDWLNARKLDNSFADLIVQRVLKNVGFS